MSSAAWQQLRPPAAAQGDRLECPLAPVLLRRAASSGRGAAERLAHEHAVSRDTAARWLAAANAAPRDELLTAELLSRLYLDEALSTREIAARLSVGRNRVLRALAAAGIETRPRAAGRRKGPAINAERVIALYVDEGHTLDAVGAALGVTRYQLQRLLRELGVHKRRGRYGHGTAGARSSREVDEQTRRLVGQLYADADVCAALQRHGVTVPLPSAWQPPSPWQTYAPQPLQAALLYDLYHHRGLSTRQIGLLCGVSSGLVRSRMRRLGVPLRQRGSRPPWGTGTRAGATGARIGRPAASG